MRPLSGCLFQSSCQLHGATLSQVRFCRRGRGFLSPSRSPRRCGRSFSFPGSRGSRCRVVRCLSVLDVFEGVFRRQLQRGMTLRIGAADFTPDPRGVGTKSKLAGRALKRRLHKSSSRLSDCRLLNTEGRMRIRRLSKCVKQQRKLPDR